MSSSSKNKSVCWLYELLGSKPDVLDMAAIADMIG